MSHLEGDGSQVGAAVREEDGPSLQVLSVTASLEAHVLGSKSGPLLDVEMAASMRGLDDDTVHADESEA